MPPVSILAGNTIRAGKAVSGNIVVLRAAARHERPLLTGGFRFDAALPGRHYGG